MKKLIMGTSPTVKDVEDFLNAVFNKQKIELQRTLFIARVPICDDMTLVLFSIEGKIPIGSEIEITETQVNTFF